MLPRLTLAFLALPALPFLVGWVRPVVAVPVVVGLAAGVVTAWRQRDEPRQGSPVALDRVLVIALVVVLAILSGAGGVGHQRIDWSKHNAVLCDLSTMAWPVVYGGEVQPEMMLSYALGYYLPAAVVGSVAGLTGAHIALLAWTAIGLGLTAAWVARLTGRVAWVALVAWLGFNGMDVVGVAVLGGSTQDLMQWWAGFMQYTSNPSLLFWTPQHALAGWLGAALVVHGHERRWPVAASSAVVALVVLWSPFAALGLLPLLAASVLKLRPRLRALAFAAACAAPYAVVVSVFLLGGERAGVPSGWLVGVHGPLRGIGLWVLFVAVEVGIPLAVLIRLHRLSGMDRSRWCRVESGVWLAPVTATLVLLPAAYLGMYNDLGMRASIPALFVLAVMVLRLTWVGGVVDVAPVAARILVLALLIGAVQPATDLASQVMWSRGADREPGPPLVVTLPQIPTLISSQYVMDPDGSYGRWLAPRR